MRELKFRVWDKEDKKMIFMNGIFNRYPFTEKSTFPQYDSIKIYHEVEVMQFTGLHDKNGKDIYEGDIIQCAPRVEYYRVVVWKEDGNYWMVNPDKKMDFEIQCVISSHDKSRVVGNIYENPELMKTEK